MRFDKLNDGVNFNLKIERFAQAELVRLNDLKDRFYIICQHSRPGSEYFFQWLEQTHFEPDTPVNKEYEFLLYRWLEWPPLLWTIASIPLAKQQLAFEAAEEATMRLADGVPFQCGPVCAAIRPAKFNDPDLAGSIQWFPIDNNNAYTLENHKDTPAYEPGGGQDINATARAKTKKLWDERLGEGAWLDYQRRCGARVRKTRPGQQRFDPNG